MSDTSKAVRDVERQLAAARKRFPAFNSSHEGFAVILEEVDELWDDVKGPDDSKRNSRMREEAVQVAAMAIRFIEDVCDKS